jgi:hypothetical protein
MCFSLTFLALLSKAYRLNMHVYRMKDAALLSSMPIITVSKGFRDLVMIHK